MTTRYIRSSAGPFRRQVARCLAYLGTKALVWMMKKETLNGVEVRSSSEWFENTHAVLDILKQIRPSALDRLARAGVLVISMPLESSISFPLRTAYLNLRSPSESALDLAGISRAIQVFPSAAGREDDVERVIQIVRKEMELVRDRLVAAGLPGAGEIPWQAQGERALGVAIALWNESVLKY